jgi:hypothetical protein
MTKNDPEKPAGAKVTRFPQSRVAPPGAGKPFRQLGASDLSRKLGAPDRQGTGHWCSRCQGIWYGYPLEVTCPSCGRRGR